MFFSGHPWAELLLSPRSCRRTTSTKRRNWLRSGLISLNFFPSNILGEIHPCFVSQGRAGAVTEFVLSHAQSQGKSTQNQHFGPGKILCGILKDRICSLTLELPFLPKQLVWITRNILWPVWTMCSTWSVVNWDCSQWAEIVFGTVIKSGFRAPRQL